MISEILEDILEKLLTKFNFFTWPESLSIIITSSLLFYVSPRQFPNPCFHYTSHITSHSNSPPSSSSSITAASYSPVRILHIIYHNQTTAYNLDVYFHMRKFPHA